MTSLIANKIKKDFCLVSIKLFIVRSILCVTIYNSILLTIICLFVNLLTQLFAIQFTTGIFKLQLFSSHAMQLHRRLTEFLLTLRFLCRTFSLPYKNSLPNDLEVLAFSRILLWFHCCWFIVPKWVLWYQSYHSDLNLTVYTCCCVRLLVYPVLSDTGVVGLVVTSSQHLLV